MKLIIGLGNPGKEYSNTRHNVGFEVINKILELNKTGMINKEKLKANIANININKTNLILAQPTNFMNLSGESVSSLSRFYKINPSNIIVIHDDIDLPLGKIKVKIGGGSGGHNGLKSIDKYIGKEYLRIRIGIGRPENPKYDISSYVLEKFSTNEKKIMDNMINKTTSSIQSIIQDDINKIQSILCN